MTLERSSRELLPEAVSQVLADFAREFRLDLHLWAPLDRHRPHHLFPPDSPGQTETHPDSILLSVPLRNGTELVLEVRRPLPEAAASAAHVLRTTLEHLYDNAEEIRFFTYEVSERYEEINLLYSIAETLGSLLRMRDAARLILTEVCDVMGARRGALWVRSSEDGELHLEASVGPGGKEGPISISHSTSITSLVFRDGRPLILSGDLMDPAAEAARLGAERNDSILSVPIRYTPPSGQTRTVGVINLIGRRRGGRFTASDQKLLSAIASQVGAALENHRLMEDSLEQERMGREMELAHNLQMKLLPAMDAYDPLCIAARVEPAESVGGDFYHLFRLAGGRFGVMIGDVSSHGFPAALIMALSLSAATIYASEVEAPEEVLSGMAHALRDELETTEMYLTLFYGVLDPEAGEMVYANAGHPHAFVLDAEGEATRLPALDPPMGIADPADYHARRIPWRPGSDLLLLFTDGLSDTLNLESRLSGERKVVSTVARMREAPARDIVDALFDLERLGDPSEGDDRTAVVVRV
ncbi:MAG: GAF domain-containing protein [Gemmatimonadales bacterium]|nr:MAG: GAF domain-containing protein [Gemmatimonadales bacterium]